MIRHILLPCDFSEPSQEARDYAVTVARWYKADIKAIHVLPLLVPPGAVPSADLIPLDPALGDRLLEELRRFMEPVQAAGIEVKTEVLLGTPAAEILRQSELLPADLVVMGTHGSSGLARWAFGSVTERVLRRCTRPLLTVPPLVGDRTAPPKVTEILCPVDFSPSSTKAIDFALSIARETRSRLTLLHVIEGYPEPIDLLHFDVAAYVREAETRARERLRDAVPARVRVSCPPDEIVKLGKPWPEILRTARERHADLIVMGVAGHGAFERMLFGSTARHVVEEAECPVLSLRAG